MAKLSLFSIEWLINNVWRVADMYELSQREVEEISAKTEEQRKEELKRD